MLALLLIQPQWMGLKLIVAASILWTCPALVDPSPGFTPRYGPFGSFGGVFMGLGRVAHDRHGVGSGRRFLDKSPAMARLRGECGGLPDDSGPSGLRPHVIEITS